MLTFTAPLYTATALAYNVTVALFGGTAPYVSTWLIAHAHNPIAPAWYLTVMAFVALSTALVGLRSRTPASTSIQLPADGPTAPKA